MIESLRKLGTAYGPDVAGARRRDATGRMREPLARSAEDLANRMIRIFTRDANGRRPVYGGIAKFQEDPHWRDLILFHEYFHGDTGEGLGASHQTGWTGLVASLIDEWRRPARHQPGDVPRVFRSAAFPWLRRRGFTPRRRA